MSSAYVAEAFRLAFPNGATERVIVALTAYFDESGTHANSPAVSVAGYLASDASWSAFADDWREALAIYNIPAFHMTDFVGGRGAFTAWPKAKRHPRLMKLIAIANRHVMATFGCAIDLETYRAVTRPRPGTEMISAYNLLAVTCFIEVREYLQRVVLREDVAYVFEQGARGASTLVKAFSRMGREYRALSLRFEDKGRFVPLQAADIAAWAIQNELPKQFGRNAYPQRTDTLDALHRAKVVKWSHLSESHLRAIVAAFAADRLSGEEPSEG